LALPLPSSLQTKKDPESVKTISQKAGGLTARERPKTERIRGGGGGGGNRGRNSDRQGKQKEKRKQKTQGPTSTSLSSSLPPADQVSNLSPPALLYFSK